MCHFLFGWASFFLVERAMAPHSSTLAWKIPWIEEPSGLQSMGSLRVRHYWATSLSFFLSCTGEGNGNPLQCSCLENPRDGGAWWAAIYGVAQSWTRLNRLSSSSSVLSGAIISLCFSPVAYWTLSDMRVSSSNVISFCLFLLFMGFLQQEYWSDLPIRPPVDHVCQFSSNDPSLLDVPAGHCS